MERTNIRLRPFKLRDTTELTQWGKHDDPRFFHYNFPYTKSNDLERWYRTKKGLLSRWVYAIEVDRRVVGYITLKNVKWSEKRGEMGIALDPNVVNKGIGTRAICLYLYRVFKSFYIEEIHLKTSEFNERAIACYENIGFKHIQKKKEQFEEQSFRSEILNRFPLFEHDKKETICKLLLYENHKNGVL